MTFNWQPIATKNYADVMYNFLLALEAAPNSDSGRQATLVNSNPTIGVGFDLVTGGQNVQNAVLKGMGLDPAVVDAVPNLKTNPFPSGTWQATEYGYVNSLRAQMVKNGSIATPETPLLFAELIVLAVA